MTDDCSREDGQDRTIRKGVLLKLLQIMCSFSGLHGNQQNSCRHPQMVFHLKKHQVLQLEKHPLISLWRRRKSQNGIRSYLSWVMMKFHFDTVCMVNRPFIIESAARAERFFIRSKYYNTCNISFTILASRNLDCRIFQKISKEL
ncbi:hypothetical protein ES703_27424 [subsurface metagenome]